VDGGCEDGRWIEDVWMGVDGGWKVDGGCEVDGRCEDGRWMEDGKWIEDVKMGGGWRI
jgi:hypothetical protein